MLEGIAHCGFALPFILTNDVIYLFILTIEGIFFGFMCSNLFNNFLTLQLVAFTLLLSWIVLPWSILKIVWLSHYFCWTAFQKWHLRSKNVPFRKVLSRHRFSAVCVECTQVTWEALSSAWAKCSFQTYYIRLSGMGTAFLGDSDMQSSPELWTRFLLH